MTARIEIDTISSVTVNPVLRLCGSPCDGLESLKRIRPKEIVGAYIVCKCIRHHECQVPCGFKKSIGGKRSRHYCPKCLAKTADLPLITPLVHWPLKS